MPIEVRIALWEEKHIFLEAIQQFWKEHQVFGHIFSDTRELVEKCNWAKTHTLDTYLHPYPLLCFKNEELVGVCLLRREDSSQWAVDEFYIFKRFRGRGVGREFMHHIVDFCKTKSIWSKNVSLVTSCSRTNEIAAKFWLAVGFKPLFPEYESNYNNYILLM